MSRLGVRVGIGISIFLLTLLCYWYLNYRLPPSVVLQPLKTTTGRVKLEDNNHSAVFIRDSVCYLYDPFEAPNCTELIVKDASSALLLRAEKWKPSRLPNDAEVTKILQSAIFYQHCFPLESTTNSGSFSMAIVFKVHSNLGQLIQFLQSVYRRQDVYCIAFDLRSTAEFQKGIKLIADHLSNVILPARNERIFYGHFSQLTSALHCLEALDALEHPWEYVINEVMSDDLPLRSPDEIALILQSLNGRSTFGGGKALLPSAADTKLRHSVKVMHSSDFANGSRPPASAHSWVNVAGEQFFQLNDERLSPPPHAIRLYKNIEMAVTRDFVRFVLSDPRANDLLWWLRYTGTPHEHFYASLYFSLYAPRANITDGRGNLLRYQVWAGTTPWNQLCHGKLLHHSCVFGVADLPTLVGRHELFVHKLTLGFQPAAYHCLREILQTFNKTLRSTLNNAAPP